TPYVKPGKKQTLEVRVDKESANASVNSAERRADWWLYGGIYRPVYIESMPKRHISAIAIDARADGHLTAKVKAEGADEKVPLKISVSGHEAKNVTTKYL
ncbi:beta-galactosidase, partial [Parabacteroides distasonis]